MRPQTNLHASHPAKYSRLSLDSPHDSSPDTGATGEVAQALRPLMVLAIAMLLLPLGQVELFAQQAPLPGQSESQNDPYNGQYAPDEQSGYGQQPYPQQSDAPPGQVQPHQEDGQSQPPAEPLNAERLEQLVAPIALYPDTLVAQVLTASTYPAQVADAAHWRLAQGYASPDQIAAGADAQTWDPSLKALTAFPQVLAEMDRNLSWTTDLGNAYYNQPQDVLQAVQVMRRRAQAAGNLQSTPREAVSYVQGNIELALVNSQVVYVPVYNPWSAYGQPVSPYPGYSQNTAVADWGVPQHGVRLGGGYNSTLGQGFVPRPPLSDRRPGSGRTTTLGRGFVPRPPLSDRRPRSGRTTTLGRGFVPRPPARYYAANQPREGSNRRVYSGVGAGGYSSRPGTVYRSSQRAYRAPKSAFQRANFKPRSSRSSVARGFATSVSKPPHSSGFHPFGGGRAPKGFRGGKSFGSRDSGGGGHTSSHEGGRHHH